MTLVASWVSADDKPQGKVPSAIYIGSDSRYTWQDGRNYGFGQKTFCCCNSLEIFGFCGDVLFPLVTISQLVPLIDSLCLFKPDDDADTKAQVVNHYIEDAVSNYPVKDISFMIVYGTRSDGQFAVYRFHYGNSRRLSCLRVPVPDRSTVILNDGSGNEDFQKRWNGLDVKSNGNYSTARNVFYCLADSILHNSDKETGGQPQVVGLYRRGNGRMFGFVNEGKRYLYGRETGFDYPLNLQSVEWRNSRFERINPQDMRRVDNASRHYL